MTRTHIAPVEMAAMLARTANVYSFNRYGLVLWAQSIVTLAENGFTSAEIVEVLRSKHMRWIADAATMRRGKISTRKVLNCVAVISRADVDSLMAETRRSPVEPFARLVTMGLATEAQS